jgi:hypothetical protein
MAERIPDSWRKEVMRVLQTQDERIIEWTAPALQRWRSDTSAGWKYEAYEAMVHALSQNAWTIGNIRIPFPLSGDADVRQNRSQERSRAHSHTLRSPG